MNYSYTDDSNGNIAGITNVLDPTKNKSFTYDALDRLATANSSGIWGSLGWTYDGVGNRQTENLNSYTYFANSNKLNSANGKSFGYDNNGNTNYGKLAPVHLQSESTVDSGSGRRYDCRLHLQR